MLVIGALLASAYLLGHLIAFDYGRDQGIYALVADGMLHGEPPYRGVWDFKPPGIFFIFALARVLFGAGVHAVRVLEAIAFGSLIYAFAIFSRRHLGTARPGIVGGALAVFVHVQLEFWHTGQPSSFAAVVLAWALVGGTYEPREGDVWGRCKQLSTWALMGVLYAGLLLLKPPLAGAAVVSFGVLAARLWRGGAAAGGRRRFFHLTLAFAVGALLPLLCTQLYFVAAGALADMYDALFLFAPQYTGISLEGDAFIVLLARAVEEWLFEFSLVSTVGLALLFALPILSPREREGALHVLGIVGLQLVGVAVQAKFFPYHYGSALPLTALIAAWGFWKLWTTAPRTTAGILAAGMLVCLLRESGSAAAWAPYSFWERSQLRLAALLDPSIREETNDRLYSSGDVSARANRKLAEWLLANSPADEPVYIWGFEPAIYQMAQRRPASRYVYNVAQRAPWLRAESRRILLGELDRSPPAVIIVEHSDVIPWVTGDNLDSAAALQDFPELTALIRDRYQMATRIEKFDLYICKRGQVCRGDRTAGGGLL